MSLLKCFQHSNLTLPKPDGLLSQVLPLSSIITANKRWKGVLDQSNKPGVDRSMECTSSSLPTRRKRKLENKLWRVVSQPQFVTSPKSFLADQSKSLTPCRLWSVSVWCKSLNLYSHPQQLAAPASNQQKLSPQNLIFYHFAKKCFLPQQAFCSCLFLTTKFRMESLG